ncbi:MAG: Rpn family recombination-promoting nuclease/putative transposase, partial [Oscillospiraceae bacterium]|nr:Rpn family recombination-promoting nuclease/putative transposase [Oscillospiraceae bacterium]
TPFIFVTHIYEKGELELASSILCIHNIELRKFKRMKYDKQNPLHRWLHILSRGYKTINEIETKEVIGMDAGLQQFVDKYSLSLQDPQIQAKYTQHRLAELDYNSSIDTAHEKGMEKMLRILMKQKNLSSAELQMMAQQAGISDERYEQIYNEEMATLS